MSRCVTYTVTQYGEVQESKGAILLFVHTNAHLTVLLSSDISSVISDDIHASLIAVRRIPKVLAHARSRP